MHRTLAHRLAGGLAGLVCIDNTIRSVDQHRLLRVYHPGGQARGKVGALLDGVPDLLGLAGYPLAAKIGALTGEAPRPGHAVGLYSYHEAGGTGTERRAGSGERVDRHEDLCAARHHGGLLLCCQPGGLGSLRQLLGTVLRVLCSPAHSSGGLVRSVFDALNDAVVRHRLVDRRIDERCVVLRQMLSNAR